MFRDPLVLDVLFLFHIWKGLISVVTLSVVVPQAIGNFIRNKIGDHTGEFLVISFGGFIGIQCSWSALISLFLSLIWGHVFLVVSDRSKFCLSLSFYLLFWLFFFLYASFSFTVSCTHGFSCNSRVYTWIFCKPLHMLWVFPFWRILSVVGWVWMIAESSWMFLESVYTFVSNQRRFLVWIFWEFSCHCIFYFLFWD